MSVENRLGQAAVASLVLKRKAFRAASVFGLVISVAQTGVAGKLDKAGDETRRSSDSGGGSSSSGSSSHFSMPDEIGDTIVFLMFYYTFLSPFTIPHAVAKEHFPMRLPLAAEPFSRPGCGYYCGPLEPTGERDEEGWEKLPPSLEPGAFGSLFLDLEGGYAIQNVAFAGLSLDASLASPGLGLDSRMTLYREWDDDVADYALLGKSHLYWRFATMPHAQFRVGLGMRYFVPPASDSGDAQAKGLGATAPGFDFLYGVDIQWLKPVDTQLEVSLGNAGSAFVPELRGTIGAWIGPLRLAAGWDQVWIGREALGGPLLTFGGRF